MKHCSFLMFVLMCVAVGSSLEQSSIRAKRIVRGFDMWDNQAYHYKPFQYYVWIGRTWVCRIIRDTLGWWRYVPLLPVSTAVSIVDVVTRLIPGCAPGSDLILRCGGSLITPQIVQSACHCFAKPSLGNKVYLFDRMYADDRLEDHLLTFMGQVTRQDMTYPITVTKVELHPQCGRINFGPPFYQYDFGWAILEESVPLSTGVTLGHWGHNLDYAGPYRTRDLNILHEKVLGERHVCLIMGFGNPEVTDKPSDLSLVNQMRHGYMQMMNWWECYHYLITLFTTCGDSIPRQVKLNFIQTYNQSVSWVCAKQVPVFNQYTGVGDSGSPVSCHGQYFALISQTISADCREAVIRGVGLVEIFAPAVSDFYSLSVESRQIFESNMYSTLGSNRPTPRSDLRDLWGSANWRLKKLPLKYP